VKRGHLHGRAADHDRLEHGERRHGARPADVDLDLEETGDRLLGWKLEGDGPAELRRVSQRFGQEGRPA
jgi:hypothetical protein